MQRAAFTYDLTTLIGQVRQLTGDTEPERLSATGGDRTRTDEEIDSALTRSGGKTLAAAAELLEIRATEYARDAVVVEQGRLRQDLTKRSQECLASATALRTRIGGPVATHASDPQLTMADMQRW